MLDKYLVPVVRKPCKRVAYRLATFEITANQISIAGFVAGCLCVVSIAYGQFWLALVLLAANRVADGIDGELARLSKPTDAGAFLDICLDFNFYALFPIGFALHNPETNALPAAILIASFIGTSSSFLAFSGYAQQRGIDHPEFGYKGLYYLDGLMEGAETILFFVLMCIFDTFFPQLALLFAALCVITTANRLFFSYSTLKNLE